MKVKLCKNMQKVVLKTGVHSRSYYGSTVGIVYNNVLGDILDSKNPEDYETPIKIPLETVAISM